VKSFNNKNGQAALRFWISFAVAASSMVLIPVFADEQGQLAEIVSRYFDAAFLARSAAYHRFNLILFLSQSFLLLAVLFVFARGPLGRWSRTVLTLTRGRAWLARAALLSGVHISLGLLRLPFSVVRFYHAHAYGLREDTLGIYLLDWFKGFLIVWLMVLTVGLIILGLFARFPRGWVTLATSLIGIIAVGYALISPLVVDPLFYEFRPLEDPFLKQRILDLGRCGGLEIEEIQVADASRRSPTVNAYVTGIGRTARIIVFDTLLEKFSPDEVAMVLAHEMGHRLGLHIPIGLVLGVAGLLIALLIADRVLQHCVQKHLRGITSRRDPALVLPAYTLYAVLMFVAVIPGNLVSRSMEAEADRTALRLTRNPGVFIQTEVRIAKANLSDVLPPAAVEFALFTHPSIANRIRIAEDYPNESVRSAKPCPDDTPGR
jgi:STE24 endopeptidase